MSETDGIQRQRMARGAHLRTALEFALDHGDAQSGVDAILGALGTLMEEPPDGLAFEMARTGILALVYKGQAEREAARRWHATHRGHDPDQDALTIVDLAEAVDRAAFLYTATGIPFETGDAAIENLRAGLVERHGPTVPPTADLLAWFSKLGKPKSQGGLTVEGIVARIVHQGRLLGTSHDDLDKTRKRVDRVLNRGTKRAK